jgi:plastocyanin
MRLDRLIKLLPAVTLLVVGCNLGQEATTYSYMVVNYSPNTYIVQTTFEDGVVADLAVAPETRTGQLRPSPPVEAVVYEQDCSHKIATLHPGDRIHWIFIDKSGNVSAPATMSDFDVTAVPYQGLPIPSSCP